LLSPRPLLLTSASPEILLKVASKNNHNDYSTSTNSECYFTNSECYFTNSECYFYFNYEFNVFRYNKILIDCVFGNSKFVVPSTLTINLGFASVNSQCLGDNKLAIPSSPVLQLTSLKKI
jgi:hypothetical protein